MSIAALIPAGIAATTLARGASAAVESGLSFLSQLGGGESPTSKSPAAATPDRQEFEARLRDFAHQVQQRLSASGAGSTGPLELVSDGLGGVQVSGDHPDRARIEQVLSGDAALLARFQQLADEAKQLNPAENSPDRRDFGVSLAGDKVATFFA
ncbi:MAG: hypothetical protein SFU86_25570 [Pirellulaceae bacterium]|nr:hypothetical protein [Pirellulaceae bacterium]